MSYYRALLNSMARGIALTKREYYKERGTHVSLATEHAAFLKEMADDAGGAVVSLKDVVKAQERAEEMAGLPEPPKSRERQLKDIILGICQSWDRYQSCTSFASDAEDDVTATLKKSMALLSQVDQQIDFAAAEIGHKAPPHYDPNKTNTSGRREIS